VIESREAKDYKIVLEDPRGRELVCEDSSTDYKLVLQ